MKKLPLYALLVSTILFSSGCSNNFFDVSHEEQIHPIVLDISFEDAKPSLVNKSFENNFVFDINKIKNCPEYTSIEQHSNSLKKDAFIKSYEEHFDEKSNLISSSVEFGDIKSTYSSSIKFCKNKDKQIEIKTINSTNEELE